jgi:hypothetical protein
MRGYNPSRPHAAFCLIAVTMTAVTMAALVALPAKLESVGADPKLVNAAKPTDRLAVAAIPAARARIDKVWVRAIDRPTVERKRR